MAYDSLKALIRQYIKTNGEQEITGQILQNVLIEMVNQYPSTDGFATQSWVTSQGYITASQLAGYLPLTGGTLTGDLYLTNGEIINIILIEGRRIVDLNLGYSQINGTEYAWNMNIESALDVSAGLDMDGVFVGSGFKKIDGTSAQFLKADGSVDSNTYITASALSGYATQSWVTSQLAGYATTSQLAGYLPLTGGTLTGDLYLTNGEIINIILIEGRRIVDLNLGYSQINGTEYAWNMNIESALDVSAGLDMDGVFVGSGFKKIDGTSAQFLKADGSVDSNTYITASALSGYATQSWVTSQLAGYLPLTGGTLTGDLYLTNGEKINIILIEGRRIVELNLGYSQISGTEYAWNMYIESALDVYAGLDMDGVFVGSGFKKIDGTSAQFLKADGSVDSNTYLPKQGNSFYFITDADMPETAANISTLNAAHRMTLYRNAILMPYQMDNANDGGFIRSRGTSESSAIFEIGMWDDSGAGETIQFNYYPTTSTINPTYSVTVPKKSGTIALTSDLASYNPTTNFKTINNQSIIGTGNINIEGGGGTLYDAEIEYLESNSSSNYGEQYIDTLFSANQDTSVILDCMYVKDNTGAFFYFGNEKAPTTSGRYSLLFETANRPRSDYNKSLAYMSTKQVKNQRATLYKNKNITYIDGNQVAISTYGAFQTDGNMYLYGCLAGGGFGHGFNGLRIYSCKIYDNNTLVRDFIPVRVGNVGYLYDKVSGELFGNAGTGSFVLGQDTGPGGGLPYLPLTGGTITGNLTVNGNNGINFGTDDDVYIKREYSRLLIINEAGNDIIIGDYDNRKFTSIVNDLQGGTTDSTYRSVTQKWLIRHDGDAYFKSVSQTSDLNKKTIIGDVPINLYNVANAPLFKFTWNNETKYSGQHIGSAAQYWQTVLPELVSIGRDADMTLAMQYDVIALASAITVAKTVVNHEERIILLERENEALKKEIADLKSA